MTEKEFRDVIASSVSEAKKTLSTAYMVGILEASKFYILHEATK